MSQLSVIFVFLKLILYYRSHSVQFRSVVQSCPTLCDPMNHSTPGLPVHHQLQEFTQTQVHLVSDAIQPSHPLSTPSPPGPNPSQHQSLFQWVNSSHEVDPLSSPSPSDPNSSQHQSLFQWVNLLRASKLSFVHKNILVINKNRAKMPEGEEGPNLK